MPTPKNAGQFHSVQQPSLVDTGSAVASATPSHAMRPANSNVVPEPRVGRALWSKGATERCSQPTELAPTSDSPAPEPNKPKGAASPANGGAKRFLQQPESVFSPSGPSEPISTGSQSTETGAFVNCRTSRARLRLPDMVLPAKPQGADTDPGQGPRFLTTR